MAGNLPFGLAYAIDVKIMNKTNENNAADNLMDQDVNPQEEENTTGEDRAEQPTADAKKDTDAEDKLAEKEKELAAQNDKFLRLYSEFENYRRRTAKEKLELMSTAGADIVRDLLPVLDDFDRAVQSLQDTPDAEPVTEGMILIQNKLLRTLEQKGLKPMDAKGKEFDTEYHEAITNIPAPKPELKGKVVDVAEKGYFFKDKVLRFAKVVVGQ